MVIRVCCDVHRLFPQKLAPDHVRDACSNPRALLLDLPLTQQHWPLDWNWGIWLDNYISLTFWPRWRTPIGDHKSLTVKCTSEWEKFRSTMQCDVVPAMAYRWLHVVLISSGVSDKLHCLWTKLTSWGTCCMGMVNIFWLEYHMDLRKKFSV